MGMGKLGGVGGATAELWGCRRGCGRSRGWASWAVWGELPLELWAAGGMGKLGGVVGATAGAVGLPLWLWVAEGMGKLGGVVGAIAGAVGLPLWLWAAGGMGKLGGVRGTTAGAVGRSPWLLGGRGGGGTEVSGGVGEVGEGQAVSCRRRMMWRRCSMRGRRCCSIQA